MGTARQQSTALSLASILDSVTSPEYTLPDVIVVLMGDRPAAGQRPLEPLTVVRIHVPQLTLYPESAFGLAKGAFLCLEQTKKFGTEFSVPWRVSNLTLSKWNALTHIASRQS